MRKSIPGWKAKVVNYMAVKLRLQERIAMTVFSICTIALIAGTNITDPAETITWKIQDPKLVGTYRPQILGNPAITKEPTATSLSFNGVNDGLIIPTIPIEGWSRFTIEVLFKPAGDGPSAPRFVHFQDKESNRGTIEVRVTPKGQWYLDTFLKNGKTNDGLTLIDSTILHPTDKWYWAALVYDGKKMTSYVEAVKELEGDVNFVPMTTGQISLGVRLNKVNWFKGQISEIRFHPAALDKLALQHR
ncbi:MAG: hypothetical protein JWQ40_3816 [Segetibacter sp.]|nr:hypothetical protein [Segetibacter sp.]